MSAARAALAGLAAALLAGVAGAAPVDIAWAPADAGQPKAANGALLVPVALGELTCLMQVDTAASDTVFYRGTLPAAWFDKAGMSVTLPGLSLGEVPLGVRTAAVFRGPMSEPGAAPCGPDRRDVVVGTLGLDVLKGGSLVIDLGAGRLEFIDRGVLADAPADSARVFRFARLDGVDAALPVIGVAGRSGRHYRMLLDTGSAPVGILFYREREWLDETSFASRTPEFPIVRWGRPATCRYGEGKLRIPALPADVEIADKVSYCSMAGEPVAEGNPMNGLLGLLPFENQRLTIDFVHRLASVEASRPHP